MQRVVAALIGAGLLTTALLGIVPAAAVQPGPRPDPTLTPGGVDSRVSQANIAQTICVPGYTKTVRRVSTKTRSKAYVEYHVSKRDQFRYTLDHLIPLELGGSNTQDNLWPEPTGGDMGSSSKDQVERNLHSLVCAGTVPLAAAQLAIVANWTTAETTVTATTTTTTTTTTTAPPRTTSSQPRPSTTPAPGPPAGATAICNDGTYSFSQHRRGTCSYHGGVREFIAPIPP
jgi:hypothetical protein